MWDSENGAPVHTAKAYPSGSVSNSTRLPIYCGVDGAAILLKYWDDNFNEAFIESGKETAETFASYLIDEKYLLDESLSGSDIVHGSGVIFKSSTGISDYIKDRGLSSSYAITDVSYSWSTITTQVTTNNAILLAGTDAETHPDYPRSEERR